MRKGRGAGIVLGVVGMLAASVLALGVAFFLRPFWFFERLGRMGLTGSGLKKTRVEGPKGPLVYWKGGSGPTLILLHGASDQAGAWARVARPLAKRHRVLVLDLPGHGESAPAGGPLPVPDLLAGIEAVHDTEAPTEKATLVGNSLGGFLALVYAREHPERLAHVVLVNGGAVPRARPALAELNINLLPRDREEARRTLAALTGPDAPRVPNFVLDDLVRRAAGSPLARILETPFMEHSLEGRLGEVRVPVSLVWGDSDRLMPVSYAEQLARELPAARLTLVPRCGHVPQRECPERFLPLLEQALAQPPAGGS